MNKRAWARVQDGKIVQGPIIPPENYFSKTKLNSEITKMDATELGWVPVYDNSQEVDPTKFAVSLDYKIEVFSDRIVKTHKIKEFPKEFVDAFNAIVKTSNPSGAAND